MGQNAESPVKSAGQMKYEELREAYPVFYYRGWQQEETEQELHIVYHFEIPGLAEFHPEWRFPKKSAATHVSGDASVVPASTDRMTDDVRVKKMIFSLGLVELISYWKTACPPRVVIEAGYLDEEQKHWWKEQYYHGLGEFFYTNGIALDPEGFLILECSIPAIDKNDADADKAEVCQKVLSGYLIPVGGGKDSSVTMDLLKEYHADSFCYMINGRGATMWTAQAAGFDEERIVLAKRSLDSNMLELNRRGFLNGHTPFSAIVAFSSILAAYLQGLKYVVLSNESSANESTVAGSTVNHQYSKSFQFERSFHDYEKKYMNSGVFYFSLLRPWSEYQIAAWFAGLPRYHALFRSCNVGSKQDIWCGHCPKCLFVYLILSPFLSPEQVREIFGKDMLTDAEMIPVMDQLIGMTEEKPFECVGSRDEINWAVSEALRQREASTPDEELPALLKHYKETGLYEQYAGAGDEGHADVSATNPYWNFYEEENLVPEHLQKLLRGIDWSAKLWKG